MNFLFRLLLTFNATSLLLIIYLVQKGCTLKAFFESIKIFADLSPWISYSAYVTVPITLTLLSIYFSRFLGRDHFKIGDIDSIEYANNSFLPSYLGYFFVALSISTFDALIFVYAVLFVFTFLSQALYFNPLFLVFGYKFYNVKSKSGVTIFLITRKNFKIPREVEIEKVYRINNYTFIER